MANLPGPCAPFVDVVAAIGAEPDGGIRAAMAAVTRRVRNACDLPGDAHVFWITGRAQRAEWRVCMSPITQAAFRRALADEGGTAA